MSDDIDEFDILLMQQFLQEADLIEDALFLDRMPDDMMMTDEEIEAGYRKLIDRLIVDGIYRDE